MGTSVAMLKEWFDSANTYRPGATHMIVKYDSFDGESYPVYVVGESEARRVVADKSERTMEVYKMSLGWEAQGIGGKRVFNY